MQPGLSSHAVCRDIPLAELGAERSIQTVIDQKLDTYAELEPEVLEAAGGDEFWQPPLHGVEH